MRWPRSFEAGVGIAGADQDQDDGGEDEGLEGTTCGASEGRFLLVLAALPRLRTARNDNGKENFISVTRSTCAGVRVGTAAVTRTGAALGTRAMMVPKTMMIRPIQIHGTAD